MIHPYLLPLFWLLLVIVEAWYNWYVIEVLHRRVNHRWHTAYRVAIGFAFWITSPVVSHRMELSQWWALFAVLPTMFWAMFDLLLNWMRGRYLCYLGQDAQLDRLQKKYGGEELWFAVRWVLVIGVLVWYYTI